MMQTSTNNFYGIGYDKPLSMRENPHQQLAVSVGACTRKPQSLKLEALTTAALIHQNYSTPAVMFSGGMDSEIVLQSFLGMGIKPVAIFLDYGTNTYDKYFAETYCRYYGIPLNTVTVNAAKFFREDICLDVGEKYQSANPGIALYCHAIEALQKEYFLVLGDEPHTEFLFNPMDRTKDEWTLVAREWTYATWKPFIRNDIDGCPNFLQYTPELLSAWFAHPWQQQLHSQSEVTNSTAVKYQIYQAEFGCKPRHKSTGMEAYTYMLSYRFHRSHLDLNLAFEDEIFVPLKTVMESLDGSENLTTR